MEERRAPKAKKERSAFVFTPETENKEHEKNIEKLKHQYHGRAEPEEVKREYEHSRAAFDGKPVRNYVPIFAMRMTQNALDARFHKRPGSGQGE